MSTTPKKSLKKITDAPDGDAKIVADDNSADAPNTSDDDAGSTDSQTSPYSLRNRNHSLDAADGDYASPNDASSPDSLVDSKP